MCWIERAWRAILGAVGVVVLWFLAVGGLEALNIVGRKGEGIVWFGLGFLPALILGSLIGWNMVKKMKPLTADEFWEWTSLPGNGDRRVELVRGEVVEVPIPGERHGLICAWLCHLLWREVRRCGCEGMCGAATALLVEENPDTILVPDLLLLGESRPFAKLSSKYSTSVPRLIVEVLSPSDELVNVKWRISRYLARGVPLVWSVETEERRVTIYRLGQENRVVGPLAELTGEEVLPGLRLRVAELCTLPTEAPIEARP